MSHWPPRSIARLLLALVCAVGFPALAVQPRQEAGRLDALALADPSRTVGPESESDDDPPVSEPARGEWQTWRDANGGAWEVTIDRRSGAPLLVQGRGIGWIAGSGNARPAEAPATLEGLERSIRDFIGRNRRLLHARDEDLVLDRAASGSLTPETWQVVFNREVEGIPVQDDRYLFTIGHGNLIAFGATRWGPVRTAAAPSLDSGEALARLRSYMGITADGVEVIDPGALRFIPMAAPGTGAAPYSGPIGEGYRSALAWRFAMRVSGEPGTWVGLVDAHGGEVLALYDDDQYARAKGGVYPLSNDQICPDGCEQAGTPMPFANVTVGAIPRTANPMGLFNCSPAGETATTTLAGPYVRVVDGCGAVSQSTTCAADLDLMTGPGTDCAVPSGASPGNTHAARSSFYHLNRIIEKAQAWLPANVWLTQPLTSNVNINATCGAVWSGGAVNFYRSGSVCRNAGEIASVFLHEWGHGLDQNDGGGFDNPSEAYADITSFLQTHSSCIGRGFFKSGTCSGYGNACLTCTGVRDQDWDKRSAHAPTTPARVAATCTSGTGPCGRQVHCESYMSGETIWDLATRDLPAAGFDPSTAWQITDRLWYRSRLGSGGGAYNCSGTVANGCAAGAWFMKLRTVDDDDGNLANGTPHAAAIFAAFNRHGIACGAAGDASNQSTSSCPALAAPALSGSPYPQAAALSWTPVPGAASYRVLRNDAGCAAGHTIIAMVPGPSYTDSGLANGFAEYYAVQAIGSNSACEGPLSNCQIVTPGGTHVPPVPDGTFGTAMTAARSDVAGTEIALAWDTASCAAPGYHILYGDLAGVSGPTVGGGVCGIGTSGSYNWTGVPGGSLWFVVVSDDASSLEGTWGKNSSGDDRGGTTASGQCGMIARDNEGACTP